MCPAGADVTSKSTCACTAASSLGPSSALTGATGHSAPGDRDPDGPCGTLPAQLFNAVSSTPATTSVQLPLPPLVPALYENAVTSDESSFESAGTSGFLPSSTQPETILQTLPTDCLHTETADPGLDRISPPSTIVPRVKAGNRDGAVSKPFGLAFPSCKGPAGRPCRSRSPRPWRNMVYSVRDGFDQLAAPKRRQHGKAVRMLVCNQSQRLAIASGERIREALGGRQPDRPPRPTCAPCGRSPWCVPAFDRGRHFPPARSSWDHSPLPRARVRFLPDIPRQHSRVPALLGPHPVPMVALSASPHTGPLRPPHRVRIAESPPPDAVRSVQFRRAA